MHGVKYLIRDLQSGHLLRRTFSSHLPSKTTCQEAYERLAAAGNSGHPIKLVITIKKKSVICHGNSAFTPKAVLRGGEPGKPNEWLVVDTSAANESR